VTPIELADTLPNGLHDAELAMLKIGFVTREVRLELDIWIGDEAEREAYRRTEIRLSGCTTGYPSRRTLGNLSTSEGR